MSIFQPTVLFLCVASSIVCLVLLLRAWGQSRARLLLFSALCFVGLVANNLFLFLDVVVLPNVDLVPARQLASLFAVSALLWGFVWDADR